MIFLLNPFPPAGPMAQPQEQTSQSTNASQSVPPSGPPASPSQPSTLLALRGVLVSTASLLGEQDQEPARGKCRDRAASYHKPSYRPGALCGGVHGRLSRHGGKDAYCAPQALEVTRDDNALVLNISQQWLQQTPAGAEGAHSLKE